MVKNVEVIQSSRGRLLVKVDDFKFVQVKRTVTGLIFWKCVRSLCTAKFFTDDEYMISEHEKADLKHNHEVSRTKLIRNLLIKEIRKFVALRGKNITINDVKMHTLKYLSQAFTSALKNSELASLKKFIYSYCKKYRSPTDLVQGLHAYQLAQSARRYLNDDKQGHRLRICQAVEKDDIEEDLKDYSSDNLSSDSDSDDNGLQGSSNSGLTPPLSVSPEHSEDECLEVENKEDVPPNATVVQGTVSSSSTPALISGPPVAKPREWLPVPIIEMEAQANISSSPIDDSHQSIGLNGGLGFGPTCSTYPQTHMRPIMLPQINCGPFTGSLNYSPPIFNYAAPQIIDQNNLLSLNTTLPCTGSVLNQNSEVYQGRPNFYFVGSNFLPQDPSLIHQAPNMLEEKVGFLQQEPNTTNFPPLSHYLPQRQNFEVPQMKTNGLLQDTNNIPPGFGINYIVLQPGTNNLPLEHNTAQSDPNSILSDFNFPRPEVPSVLQHEGFSMGPLVFPPPRGLETNPYYLE